METPMAASPLGAGPTSRSAPLTWLALLIALLGVAGSLYLSLGLKLNACPLCFYQRSFALGIAALLAMGLVLGGTRPGLLSVLALPMVVGGLGVAGFHVYLELTNRLECPPGVYGWGTAPKQSLAVFAALFVITVADLATAGRPGRPFSPLVPLLATAMGAGLVWASIVANPPMPRPDYSQPLISCRPPQKDAP
jgi:hypothetical protein